MLDLPKLVVVILLLFLVPTVQGVEVIQREQTPQQPSATVTSPLQGVVDFIGAWWFPLLLFSALFVGGMWIWRWLKTQREKDNIFLRDFNRTKRLCLLQRNRNRIKEKPFWIYTALISFFVSMLFFVIALVLDDVPAFSLAIGSFIVGITVSGVLKISKLFAQYDVVEMIGRFGAKIIGYYMGECTTSDGYRNYLLWDRRKFLFWKNQFILKVNLNDKVMVETFDDETQKRKIEEYNMPQDLIKEGENLIVIKGEGVDQSGYFYYPLLTDDEGNVVNMDLIAFAKSREVAMLDTLYQQTEDFARVQREAININPNVRYVIKTKGESVSDVGTE
jgi:hypothetical protein